MRNVLENRSFVQKRRPAGPVGADRPSGGRPAGGVPGHTASDDRRNPAPRERRPLALLLWPPIYDFALYDLFLKPYALCRLGAWLVRCGYRVRLVNALDYTDPQSIAALGRVRREPCGTGKFFRRVVPTPGVLAAGMKRRYARYGIVEESLRKRIAAERPDIVLVSAGMTYWYPGVVEAIEAVRRCFPRVPVILGGIYPTLCPEHARRFSGADEVISGPAFPRLIRILRRLSLPVGSGSGGAGSGAEELLPLPEANWEAGVLRLNRGCPFCCAYCASRALEPHFAPGRPEALLRTVQALYQRYGTRSFAFYDDALLVNKLFGLLPFLEEVAAAGLPLSFYLPNAVHLRYLDRASAAAMYGGGFREIRLGFESSDAAFHRELDGKVEGSLLAETLPHLFAAGFAGNRITAYVLAGLPGQEVEEVAESVHYAASFGIRVRLAEYSPTPASALWPEAVRQSSFPLEEEPLCHNNTLLPMRRPDFSLEDLEALKRLTRSAAAGQSG